MGERLIEFAILRLSRTPKHHGDGWVGPWALKTPSSTRGAEGIRPVGGGTGKHRDGGEAARTSVVGVMGAMEKGGRAWATSQVVAPLLGCSGSQDTAGEEGRGGGREKRGLLKRRGKRERERERSRSREVGR